jgi:hypothetical protein
MTIAFKSSRANVNMSKKRTRWLVVALIFGLITVWNAAPYVAEFFAVDECLDRGGSYDYLQRQCDFALAHAYIPWDERHPYGGMLFWSSCAISISAFVSWMVLRRRSI